MRDPLCRTVVAKMDDTEAFVFQHLRSRGFKDIIYEPDGNVPPDFLLEGGIAVEVRRLNENEPNRDIPKGLQETSIPFESRLHRFLESYRLHGSHRWWLSIRYNRPIPRWKDLKPALEVFLKDVAASPPASDIERWVHSTVRVRAVPRTGPGESMFAIGSISDRDPGSWVIGKFEYNFQLCLEEKTTKVAPYRRRYPKWWLVLVDHVAYGLDASDLRQYRETFAVSHDWDRVIVISAINANSVFEL